MGTLSVWHILIVAAIILLLFGGQGKISNLMGDVGRGIKAFRIGLAQPENSSSQPGAAVSAIRHDPIESMIDQDNVVGARMSDQSSGERAERASRGVIPGLN